MSTVDIHCHILPGLDDGSPDQATSARMARMAVAHGIGTVVATPHWVEDEQEISPQIVRQAAVDVQTLLLENSIPLTVLPGHEAFICPDLPDRLRHGHVLTLADKGTHLLLELPYEEMPIYVDSVVFGLQLQGVTPILAHVERYQYVRRDWRVLERWIQHGCLAQVNAASLGPRRRDGVAQELVDRGLIACTATDAHDAVHRPPCSIWNGSGLDSLIGTLR